MPVVAGPFASGLVSYRLHRLSAAKLICRLECAAGGSTFRCIGTGELLAPTRCSRQNNVSYLGNCRARGSWWWRCDVVQQGMGVASMRHRWACVPQIPHVTVYWETILLSLMCMQENGHLPRGGLVGGIGGLKGKLISRLVHVKGVERVESGF